MRRSPERDDHMVAFRRPKPQATTETLITYYWVQVLTCPRWIAGLKPSTVAGYGQNWKQFLKEHFTRRTFR